MSTNYYCSQKFWWLTVNLDKLETQSCCAAYPHKINLEKLRANPGNLFNSEELLTDRQMMLDNIPVPSCQTACWDPEKQGITSRRLFLNSNVKTHEDKFSTPEFLAINIGSDCNMTCVYCTKQYSTAWYRDILEKEYDVVSGHRYIITTKDKVINNLSQKNLHSLQIKNELFNELAILSQTPTVKTISISGGEPFLYNYLIELLSLLPTDVSIYIHTGLGVDTSRFIKILDQITKSNHQIIVVISGESSEQMYEFVRYGNSWKRFNQNLEEIKKRKMPYEYACTLTNLTIFDVDKFVKTDPDANLQINVCTDPDFLSINVLDDDSKKLIMDNVENYPEKIQEIIKSSLYVQPTENQIKNFKKYIIEYSSRRNLKLGIFPESFVKWIES